MPYVSDELTHFVGRRQSTDDARFDLLCTEILDKGVLLSNPAAGPMMSGNVDLNWDARISDNEMFNPEMVCFCDIPLEDLGLHMGKYSRFGVAFSKAFLKTRGANPVHYIARGSLVTRANGERYRAASQRVSASPHYDPDAVDEMVRLSSELTPTETTRAIYFEEALSLYREAHESGMADAMAAPDLAIADEMNKWHELFMFMTREIWSYLKFWDEELPDDHEDNYYMEREWRILGNVAFTLADVTRVIVPSNFEKPLEDRYPDLHGRIKAV